MLQWALDKARKLKHGYGDLYTEVDRILGGHSEIVVKFIDELKRSCDASFIVRNRKDHQVLVTSYINSRPGFVPTLLSPLPLKKDLKPSVVDADYAREALSLGRDFEGSLCFQFLLNLEESVSLIVLVKPCSNEREKLLKIQSLIQSSFYD